MLVTGKHTYEQHARLSGELRDVDAVSLLAEEHEIVDGLVQGVYLLHGEVARVFSHFADLQPEVHERV